MNTIKIWNILVWVFLLIPFAIGGYWLRGEHFFVEYTNIGIPFGILALWGFFLYKKNKRELLETSSLETIKALWTFWRQKLEANPIKVFFFACFVNGVLWSLVSLRRHWAFQSNAADLGIFNNTIWNLTHGNGYYSSVKGGVSLLADHQSYFFFLLAPIYKFFPYAETLLILQAFGLSLGAIILFYIGKQYKLPPAITYFLPFVYWFYAPTRNANAFDFHPEVFMLPLFLGAICLLQSEKISNFFIGLLLFIVALTAKESAAPVGVGISLAWLAGAAPEYAKRRLRITSLLLIPICLGVFYFNTNVLPNILGVKYAYNESYSQFGKSAISVILSPFQQPKLVLDHLFAKERLVFLFLTLAPLGFIPLLSWRTFIAAVPGYAMLFLSIGTWRINTGYHYSIEPSIGLFWALIPGIATLLRKNISERMVFAILVASTFLFYGKPEQFRILKNSPTAHHDWIEEEVFPCISNTAYAASNALVPHLSHRHWIQYIMNLKMPDQNYVSCAIQDKAVNDWPVGNKEQAELNEILSKEYNVAYQCGALTVYEKIRSGSGCLRCTPVCNERSP